MKLVTKLNLLTKTVLYFTLVLQKSKALSLVVRMIKIICVYKKSLIFTTK